MSRQVMIVRAAGCLALDPASGHLGVPRAAVDADEVSAARAQQVVEVALLAQRPPVFDQLLDDGVDCLVVVQPAAHATPTPVHDRVTC